MDTIAVVLEEPERLVLSRLALTPHWRRTTSSSRSTGAASAPAPSACSGPAGCRRFPGMGYPLVPGYESVGRVVEAGVARPVAGRRPRLRPGRGLLQRRPRPLRRRRARLVVPGRARGADRRRARRARRPDRAGRHRPSCASPAAIAAGPDRRPRRARPPAGAARDRAGAPAPTVWETQRPRAARARSATRCSIPPTTRAATIARSTTSAATRPARHPDRAAGAGRRGRAGRLLRRAAVLRLPAGLHARGAPPRRRGMAARRSGGGARPPRRRAAVARRPDHPSQRCGRGRRAYRTAFDRSRLPQDDPRLERHAHERPQPRVARPRDARPARRSRDRARSGRRPARRRRRPRSSPSTARAASARASPSPTSAT